MFIDAVAEGSAEGALAGYYQQQRKAWGFLPNYAAAFSTRPDVAAAWHTLNTTVRDGMDRRRFEIATIAAARALRSTYCTAAHSKFLRDVCSDESTMLALANDQALDPVDQAIVTLAEKVARDAASIEDSDVQPLRDAGLTDTEILRRFAPPERKAVAPRAAAAVIILGAPVWYVYHRFGADAAQLAGVIAGVIAITITMTTMRKFSDDYYDRRAKWRHLYMCRKCGQLVEP